MKFNNDRQFVWRPDGVVIPFQCFTGLDYEATTANDIKSIGAGAANDTSVIEIGTSGVTGLKMTAAGNSVMHLFALPRTFDPKHRLRARLHWSSGSTDTADTIDWKILYTPIVYNVTAIAAPATALDTVIPRDTVPVATANAHCVTEWGSIRPNKFADNVEALLIEMEMDAFAAGLSEAKHLLALELAWTPRRLYYGDGMAHPAKLPLYSASDKY